MRWRPHPASGPVETATELRRVDVYQRDGTVVARGYFTLEQIQHGMEFRDMPECTVTDVLVAGLVATPLSCYVCIEAGNTLNLSFTGDLTP